MAQQILTLNGSILTNNNKALTYEADKFDWLGKNTEYIKEIYSLSTTLDQTNFASWTPSTTASNIKASSTLTTKETMNLEDYDYVMVWISDCNVAYNSTWTASAASCLRETCLYTQAVFRRPASVTAIEGKNFNYNVSQENNYHIYYCKYYSSATAVSIAYTTYSPCYISAITAATLSSTSSTSPTVTIKTPVLTARCSSTYFSTANAKKVDQENSTVKMKGYLYRVEAGTSIARGSWAQLVNVFNNPL